MHLQTIQIGDVVAVNPDKEEHNQHPHGHPAWTANTLGNQLWYYIFIYNAITLPDSLIGSFKLNICLKNTSKKCFMVLGSIMAPRLFSRKLHTLALYFCQMNVMMSQSQLSIRR
jgi:hypothetical protein